MEEVKLAEIAQMETAHDLWPANLDTAKTLVINRPCDVSDVYALICDRRNIKMVTVLGYVYTSAEIRNTPLGTRLGGGKQEPYQRLGEWANNPVPTIQEPAPLGQLIGLAEDRDPRQPGITTVHHGIYEQLVNTRQTDPTYDRAMELLRQNNPHYAQFGDIPRERTATEMAAEAHDRAYHGMWRQPTPEQLAGVTTTTPQWTLDWGTINPAHDYYTGD